MKPAGQTSLQKASRRLLPIVFAGYIVAYLDRANVAFANLPMSAALGFTPAVFGFGAGIFFLGYFLLEIPSTLIVQRLGARSWLTRIVVTWGICSIAMAWVRSPVQFYVARFLLGCAEAGFYPGVLVYLSLWFPQEERARAMAKFGIAAPIALMAGAPLSAMILDAQWPGFESWRWLFIIEGLPALIMGAVFWSFLTDRPRDAKWLNPDERAWLANTLEREANLGALPAGVPWWRAIARKEVILLAGAAFLCNVAGYAFVFWLPAVIRSSVPDAAVAKIAVMLPFAGAIVSSLLTARSSDRTGERKAHAAIPQFVGAVIGLALLWPSLSGSVVVALFTLLGAAAFSWIPGFWAIPNLILKGEAAAASIGLINSIGNLGGFLGPFLIGLLTSRLETRVAAGMVVAAAYAGAASLVILVRVPTPVTTSITAKSTGASRD